jgi:cephalosporin hydroxylase
MIRACAGFAAVVILSACSHKPPVKKSEKGAARPGELHISELHVVEISSRDRLLAGFYPPQGDEGWLRTARRFAVSIDPPPPRDAETRLELDFSVPNELMDAKGPVTVTVRVNGTRIGSQKYKTQGRYFFEKRVPPDLLQSSPVRVEYELDRWGTDPDSGRDVGLIVVGVNLKHPEGTVLTRDAAVEAARDDYVRALQERQARMPIEKQKELMRLFHDIPVWQHTWFHNVPIEKNPLDLWMMQQLIYEIQPEFIVETGTWRGGSALYWAHTLNGMGLENSRVITVDVGDFKATASGHPLWKKYVTYFKGSSTDPAIVSQIADLVRGHKTLVTLDSDHSMQHVYNEMKAYAPLVTPGSYLVVEDTHIDGVPTQPQAGAGPMAAVSRFLKEGGSRDFEPDPSREAFIMTFNPGGWLRRK